MLVSRKEVPASLFVGDQPETRVPSTFEGPYSTSFPSPYTSAAAPFAFPTVALFLLTRARLPLLGSLTVARGGDAARI